MVGGPGSAGRRASVTWQPRVSVIVPTRERPDDVRRALQALLNSDYPHFEVLLAVDPGEKGTTPEFLEALLGHEWHLARESPSVADVLAQVSLTAADGKRVRHLTIRGRGVSAARNAAAACADGEILAFTDDDCTVAPDWLQRIASTFAGTPELGALCGPLVPAPHDPTQVYIPEYRPARSVRLTHRFVRPWLLGVGANMAIRAAIFRRLGGFDTRLGGGTPQKTAEDINLTYRILRQRLPVYLDANNGVLHWGARAVADGTSRELQRGSWYGMGASYGILFGEGDLVAGAALGRILLSGLFLAGLQVVRGRRPELPASVAVAGFVRGLRVSRHPLQRARRARPAPAQHVLT